MDENPPATPLEQLAQEYENEDSETEIDNQPEPDESQVTEEREDYKNVRSDTVINRGSDEDTIVENDDTYLDEIEQIGRHRNIWSHTTIHDKKTITGTSTDFFNLIDSLHSQVQDKDQQLRALAINIEKAQNRNINLRNELNMNRIKSEESEGILQWLKRELSDTLPNIMDEEKVSENVDGKNERSESVVVNVDDDIKVQHVVDVNIKGLERWKSDMENLVRSCKEKYEVQKNENEQLLVRLEEMQKQLEKKSVSVVEMEDILLVDGTNGNENESKVDEKSHLLGKKDKSHEYRMINEHRNDEGTSCCSFW